MTFEVKVLESLSQLHKTFARYKGFGEALSRPCDAAVGSLLLAEASASHINPPPDLDRESTPSTRASRYSDTEDLFKARLVGC